MTAIYFDLDGTLVHPSISFGEMFDRARRSLDVPDHDELGESYSSWFFDHFADCHPEPYRTAMADLCDEFDLPTDGDSFAEALIETEVSNIETTAGVHDLLSELAGDHELGVLTNGVGHVQRQKLESGGIAEFFDAVVVSCEVGVQKPDSEIFEIAMDELSAGEYIFVADDLERDVLPAQQVGFEGVWLSKSDDSRATASIEELSAVRNIV
ncbi:HAD family hydrolase [Haladaptatus sp. NG-SE-30]